MPPKRGIVKSGNAGNSSKPSPLPSKDKDGKNEDEQKPLFPMGSKYPMSILYERYVKSARGGRLLVVLNLGQMSEAGLGEAQCRYRMIQETWLFQ